MNALRIITLALLLLLSPAALAKKKALVAANPVMAEAGLRSTNGLESQLYLGTGKGVTIGVLDAGIDITHPSLRGSISLSMDFTGQNNTDDDKGAAGHGTGIASILVGHDGGSFTGLAPAARILNARVTTADDQISDLWAGNGLGWSVKNGATVINLSLGNKPADGPLTDRFNCMVDYMTEHFGVSIVSAAGNENDSAVSQVPAGAYNGYTVGALGAEGAKGVVNYNRVTWFSNYALPSDPRSKPDLVAPGGRIDLAAADWEKDTNYYQGTGTSFAAPMVAGTLAQLIGYGQARKISTSPLLLKAIILTSAASAQKNDGSHWAARRVRRDEDYGFRYVQPLDEEQGAGRLDAVAAYRLYAGVNTRWNPLNVWREGKLGENQSIPIRLGELRAGQLLDATLTWLRHIATRDKNKNGPDGRDSYWQSETLADFTLTLLRDGVPVAQSDSDVDNVEHLSWILLADGNYSLEVYRLEGSGTEIEPFAVAARVSRTDPLIEASLRANPASARTGPTLSASGVLRDFDATAVPEPGTLGLLAGAAVLLMCRRRR